MPRRLSVGMKLGGGFGAILLLALLAVGFLVYAVQGLHRGSQQSRVLTGRLRAAKEVQLRVANVWQFFTDASLTKDKKVIEQEAVPNRDQALRAIAELQESYKDEPAVVAELQRLRDDLLEAFRIGQTMFDAYLADWGRGNQEMEKYDKACDRLIARAEGLASSTEKVAAEVSLDLESSARRSVQASVVLMLGLSIACGLLAVLLTRRMTQPILELNAGLAQLAQGHLTTVLRPSGEDELGDLAQSFNRCSESLRTLLGEVKQAASTIARASTGLTGVNGQLVANIRESSAQGATIATSAVDLRAKMVTASASSSEMTSTISEISRNTREATEVAGRAAQLAQKANVTVARLAQSSGDINGVLKTIASIASQTNLLALNAAIEASRAGDAGLGFGVVANEVKELARGATLATEAIARNVKAIQADAANASGDISEIGAVIREIDERSRSVAASVAQQSDVAAENARMFTGVLQVSSVVEESTERIGAADERSSSAATEMLRASDELSAMSASLARLVDRFQV